MADEKPIPSTAVLLLLAVLGGSGTNLATRVISPPRDDPWTGTQAKASHDILNEKINLCKGEVDKCNAKLDDGKSREHDKIFFWTERVKRLEDEILLLYSIGESSGY